jgi:hypothetical protein
MPAIDIPHPLPSAIIPPRSVIEFLVDRDVEEYGDIGLVPRTWHWVLHGGEPEPISHIDWSQADGDQPPSLPASRTSYPTVTAQNLGSQQKRDCG